MTLPIQELWDSLSYAPPLREDLTCFKAQSQQMQLRIERFDQAIALYATTGEIKTKPVDKE